MHREAAEQQLIDAEHLRLLRLGYCIAAAWNVFFVFFPLLYVAKGTAVLFLPNSSENDGRWVGLVFIAIGGTISLVMAALTVMKFLTARALQRPTVIEQFSK